MENRGLGEGCGGQQDGERDAGLAQPINRQQAGQLVDEGHVAAHPGVVDLLRRTRLQDPAAAHDHDLVRQAEAAAVFGRDPRQYEVMTKKMVGNEHGRLRAIQTAAVEWQSQNGNGRPTLREVTGSERTLPAQLVLLAMGFVHPVHEGLIEELGVELDGRGNVRGETEGDNAYHTSLDKVFSAGDMRRGQSLVVWAIREGRQCAHAIDQYLMGHTTLPR